MAVRIVRHNPPIAEGDLLSLESILGVQLPHPYREFLRQQNGGSLEPYSLCAPGGSVVAVVNLLYGITNGNDTFDLLWRLKILKERLPSGMLPIADAEGGNHVCLSLRSSDYGAVYYWDHELDGANIDPFTPVARDFAEFWEQLRKDDSWPSEDNDEPRGRTWIDPEFEREMREKGLLKRDSNGSHD